MTSEGFKALYAEIWKVLYAIIAFLGEKFDIKVEGIKYPAE